MAEVNLSHVNRLYTVLLLKAGPRHGYELIKEIGKVTGKKPSSSHIYPFLDKLEQQDLVSVEKSGERGKKTYTLTEEGEEFVHEQISSFGEMLDAVVEDRVEECSHCDCKIYDGGYEENGNVYCCKHCARDDQR